MSRINWTNELELSFIEHFQSEPCLWNINLRDYKNKLKNHDAWKRISSLMEIPIEELKTKKNSLLASYRMYRNKVKKSEASGASADDIYQPIWFAYESMDAFLGDTTKCKNTVNTMPVASFSALFGSVAKDECAIKNVWNHNLHEEFRVIRQVVKKFHWVAMDTEFPGVVARPIGEFRSTADYQYQLLRCNVDLLRIIQLGLTFMDENGKTPPGCTTWQFNFKFNLQEDMYAQDSIDLLQNSGLQFREHEDNGIEPLEFAELLMSSGIVLMDNINWLSFHSGYDFGYLLKLLTDKNLPLEENDFFESLRLYFPTVYDVKYLMKLCKNLKGGLQEVADQLELRRVGPQHQAGSDSHLTGMAFFKIKEIFFDGSIESTSGHLYGLGAPFPTSANNFQDNMENGNSS